MKLFGYEITIKRVDDVQKPPVSKVGHIQPDKPWPRQSTFTIVQMLIHRNCGNTLGKIKPESTPDDLMLDSLDEVELMMAVEEEFDIEFSLSSWESCRNVKEVCDLVDKVLMEENKS